MCCSHLSAHHFYFHPLALFPGKEKRGANLTNPNICVALMTHFWVSRLLRSHLHPFLHTCDLRPRASSLSPTVLLQHLPLSCRCSGCQCSPPIKHFCSFFFFWGGGVCCCCSVPFPLLSAEMTLHGSFLPDSSLLQQALGEATGSELSTEDEGFSAYFSSLFKISCSHFASLAQGKYDYG